MATINNRIKFMQPDENLQKDRNDKVRPQAFIQNNFLGNSIPFNHI